MNDTSQLVMSWIIIFLVFVFALSGGMFIGKASKLSSYHAQVNPIIERYGGDSSKDVYGDNRSAKNEIQKVSDRMNNKFMTFTVDAKTRQNSHDNHGSDVASFGKPISYTIHVHIPFISKLTLDNNPTYYTTSKVGEESDSSNAIPTLTHTAKVHFRDLGNMSSVTGLGNLKEVKTQSFDGEKGQAIPIPNTFTVNGKKYQIANDTSGHRIFDGSNGSFADHDSNVDVAVQQIG